ncbi:MAG TPA: MarR family winged helix-turn-helix transcriptional regulator [Terriglobales bacterium]|nr:MarR family winged helix-turn-helix transcriptional regulator [Terriglobales bacterium]
MPQDSQLHSWSHELEQLARVLGRVGPDEACCEGMTPRQCSILRTLVDKQGARLSDLATESGITPSAMTRVLEKLEAQGLVQRVRGKSKDGRAAMVMITTDGREVRRRIDELMLDRTQKIVSAIPAGFRPQLLAALRMLNQAMGPEGCCEFNGEWPEIAVSCRVMDRGNEGTSRRKRNVRQ